VPEKVPEKVIAPANHRHDGDCPIPTGEKVPGAWRHLADQSSHKSIDTLRGYVRMRRCFRIILVRLL
jgi:hypothetical protein